MWKALHIRECIIPKFYTQIIVRGETHWVKAWAVGSNPTFPLWDYLYNLSHCEESDERFRHSPNGWVTTMGGLQNESGVMRVRIQSFLFKHFFHNLLHLRSGLFPMLFPCRWQMQLIEKGSWKKKLSALSNIRHFLPNGLHKGQILCEHWVNNYPP